MMKFAASYLIIGLVVLLLLISGGIFFTVQQTQQAIVLQFGELKRVHDTPGLKLKLPLIQEVLYYEKRVLDFDLQPITVTTADQKRLEVNTYSRYRIADPVMFFQSIKPSNEAGAQMRLEAIISSSVRNVLGRVPLRNLLSEERSKIMLQILQEIRHLASPLGIDIVDIRIIRTELPPANRDAVFARMNAELDRIAKENRAKGFEISQGIKAKAEKERTVLLAEAQKNAQTVKGEGEAQAMQIATQALGTDPHFYNFYRSMQVYRESFSDDTTLVFSTDHELFTFMNQGQQVKTH
ncbi:MAG: protease modulator HflC [Proteobacteria bacterium]|nr:protease modulator HflC [Pseudomonadota bacterium]